MGIVVVVFILKEKKVQFSYGPNARTLKSIRIKKYRYFSEQSKQIIEKHQIDSLRMLYLLTKSDVDFSKSITNTKIPCQTYKIDGKLKNTKVCMIIKRCDSSATFESIRVENIQ